MKKILLSVAIWASVFGAVSRASLDTGSAEVVETLGLRDQQIYFETEKICQESQSLLGTFFNKNTSRAFWISAGEFFSLTLGNLFGTGVSSSTMQVASSSRELQEMAANYREHNLVGDYTYDRLQSAGFELALTRCYVNRPDLKRDFVVSMMAADTAGKVPSVMLMLIGARWSKSLFAKMSRLYPRVTKTLFWSSAVGTIVYGVIEIRRQTRAKELTPEEHARVARLTKGIREGRETLDEMAIELSKEEIKAQEALLLKAKTESERQKYIRNIEILKKNLVPLEQRL